MHYFIKKGFCCQRKNRLEKEVFELIDAQDRLLIPECELEEFKKKILTAIDLISAKNNKCKPVKVSFQNYRGEKDHFLIGMDCISFKIYATKN